MRDFGLSDYDAGVLVATRELADFYEAVCAHTNAYKKAANWVIVELTAALNKTNTKWKDNPCKAASLAEMINMVEKRRHQR